MYGFQVRVKETERQGSICHGPFVSQDALQVVVMWDDDYSFSTLTVDQLQAVPDLSAMKQSGMTVLNFPGDGDDTAH